MPSSRPPACRFIVGWLVPICWWVAAFIYCCSAYKDPRWAVRDGWWGAG